MLRKVNLLKSNFAGTLEATPPEGVAEKLTVRGGVPNGVGKISIINGVTYKLLTGHKIAGQTLIPLLFTAVTL